MTLIQENFFQIRPTVGNSTVEFDVLSKQLVKFSKLKTIVWKQETPQFVEWQGRAPVV